MKKITIRKEAKGITLIALVITIIVLLILAGVSIAMLTGQNGILTQAQNSKTTTEYKSAEEKVKLAIMAARSQSETGALDVDKLVAEITNNYGGTASKANDGFPVKATVDGKNFSIDGDGNITGGTTPNQEGKVTIIEGNGKNVGDIIAITSTKGTTEKFYVLSYDESKQKAKALAEWNLKVGDIYNNSSSTAIATDSDGYGLQNSEMRGYVSSGQPYNGVLAFSSSWYFKDTFHNYPLEKDNLSYYVYDSNSNLYTYVNKYKELLGNTDKVSEVSLASHADINELWSNKSKYPWLCNTSFWLGSAFVASYYIGIWSVYAERQLPLLQLLQLRQRRATAYGVRPVITVDMSKI